MRKRALLAIAAVLCACAPAPVRMPAAQASEILNLFAAGQGPANICSADGRALLRGAVRAYSREMQMSGIAWPAAPGVAGGAEQVGQVDVSIMVAFAAGFVKASDFRGARFMNQLTLTQWPEIQAMRLAARDACEEVAALQQAAAAFVVESTRFEQMSGRGDAERLRRQSVRLQRAENRMQEMAATVAARMNAL